jgi:hypothetical protein
MIGIEFEGATSGGDPYHRVTLRCVHRTELAIVRDRRLGDDLEV